MPKRYPRGTPLQSVFAMGEGGLQAEEEEHLRQCQRNHRRIDALTANGEITDDEAKGGCGENAEYETEFRRDAPDFHRMGCDIGSAAEEGRMAEGQNAGIAQEKIEGGGEQRKAQHLHQEDGVDHEGCSQQSHKGDAEDDDREAVDGRRLAVARGCGGPESGLESSISHIRPPSRTVRRVEPEGR